MILAYHTKVKPQPYYFKQAEIIETNTIQNIIEREKNNKNLSLSNNEKPSTMKEIIYKMVWNWFSTRKTTFSSWFMTDQEVMVNGMKTVSMVMLLNNLASPNNEESCHIIISWVYNC